LKNNWWGSTACLYYLTTAANNGQLNINVTFRLGTNPDTAAVQTQNKVNAALPRLPAEVQKQGVTVKKVSSAFLMAISLVSRDDRYDSLFLTNYAQINLVNQVGKYRRRGRIPPRLAAGLSMRVWVNPDKLANYGLTATDVSTAIQAQNRQESGGRSRSAANADRNGLPVFDDRARPPGGALAI